MFVLNFYLQIFYYKIRCSFWISPEFSLHLLPASQSYIPVLIAPRVFGYFKRVLKYIFYFLAVKYVIIRPLPEINCSFKISYAKYWNNSWTGLEIGHRGAGVSFGRVIEKWVPFHRWLVHKLDKIKVSLGEIFDYTYRLKNFQWKRSIICFHCDVVHSCYTQI